MFSPLRSGQRKPRLVTPWMFCLARIQVAVSATHISDSPRPACERSRTQCQSSSPFRGAESSACSPASDQASLKHKLVEPGET